MLVVGLGAREDFEPERARVAAALVEGTVLAGYRFDRYKAAEPDDEPRPNIESLTLLGAGDAAGDAAREALVASEAANRSMSSARKAPNAAQQPGALGT